MILRPVSPASPIGPPRTKLPVGLTKSRSDAVSIPPAASASTGSMTCSVRSSRSVVSMSIPSACWVEMTIVSNRTALSPSYSMVTWVFPSGRR